MRKEVTHFASQMERVLKKHDKTKGDSWKEMPYRTLRVLLDKEVEEYVGSRSPEELVDIANLCMMLYYREAKPLKQGGN